MQRRGVALDARPVTLPREGNAIGNAQRTEDAPTGEQPYLARSQAECGGLLNLVVMKNKLVQHPLILPWWAEQELKSWRIGVLDRFGGHDEHRACPAGQTKDRAEKPPRGTRLRDPGTDRTASEFPAKSAGNSCQSCQSPERRCPAVTQNGQRGRISNSLMRQREVRRPRAHRVKDWPLTCTYNPSIWRMRGQGASKYLSYPTGRAAHRRG